MRKKTINEIVKVGYNEIAEKYLEDRDLMSDLQYLNRLNNLLEVPSTILDLGCGSGVPIDKFFTDKGHKVIGIDFSDKQIALARKYVPEATFEVKDISHLKEKEYSVDAVVSFYTFIHIPRETQLSVLKKIYSFINEKGYLLLTMGSSSWEGEEHNFFGARMMWSHYNANKNRKLVQQAGFKIMLDTIDDPEGEKHLVILAQK